MATFNFIPDNGASAERQPTVKVSRFGDGYEQRVADGINTLKEVWTLTFSNRSVAEIDAIETFLRARGGAENFDWTPPRQATALKFVCRRWQRQIVAGAIDTVSATFEQVFETL